MKTVKLLQLPNNFSDWQIFEGTPFADNGGDPDGPEWLQDVRDFSKTELAAAKAAGAKVVNGYQVDYMPTDGNPFYGHRCCGYSGNRVAYSTSKLTAMTIQKHYDKQVAAGR